MERHWDQIEKDVLAVGDAQADIVEMASDQIDTSNDTKDLVRYYTGLYKLGESSMILMTRIKLLGWPELDGYTIAMMEMAEMMGIRRDETLEQFYRSMIEEAKMCVEELTGYPIDPA